MSLETPKELQRLRQAFAAEGPAAAGLCPPAERIFAAAHGELAGEAAAAELGEILDHVAACPECTEAWRLAVEIGRELEAGATAAAAEPAGGRVIAADFRRGQVRQNALRRWAAPLAAVAALLLVAIALPRLLPAPLPTDPATRGAGEVKIVDASAPLERARCVLRWRLEPEMPEARFDVSVMNEDLEPLAAATAIAERQLAIAPERLRGVPPGGRLLWSVQLSLPDGSRVSSPAFTSVLP